MGKALNSIKVVRKDGTRVEIGLKANASGSSAIAIGSSSTAADTSVAIGYSAKAGNSTNIALGNTATTDDAACSTAVGYAATVSGGKSTGVGAAATAASCSTAIGAGTLASGECAVAIGAEAEALAPGATAIGHGARAGTDAAGGAYWGTAIGCGAIAQGCGLAIGPSTAANAGQISIGTGGETCTVSATQFFAAMGGTTAVELDASASTGISTIKSVTTSSPSGIAKTTIVPMNIVGSGAVSVCANGNRIVINGYDSGTLYGETTGSTTGYTKIGCGATAAGCWSVTIGYNASGGNSAIAIGYGANGEDSAIAIGYDACASWHSVAIGFGAIGYGSGGGSSLAFGYKADPKAYDRVAFSNGVDNVYLTWSNFKAMLVAAGATVESIF